MGGRKGQRMRLETPSGTRVCGGLCVLLKSRFYLRILVSSKKIFKQGVNMIRIAYENDIL